MNIESLRSALVAQKATIEAASRTLDALLAQIDVVSKSREWMTVQQAAAYTGLSPHTIRSKARSGLLESKTTEGGGKLYVLIEK